MATYILFWNPAISSYTKKRFLHDFFTNNSVGNWSFHEHDEVEDGDSFYMIRCGEGRTGIVMRGEITSSCYEDTDWSPKNRKSIFYADIDPHFNINPWSEAPMLTPEILTEVLPDFNWFGGHSGRRLSNDMADKLDDLWFRYLDANKAMFIEGDASYDEYNSNLFPEKIERQLLDKTGGRCEVCGYSYEGIFGKHDDEHFPQIKPSIIDSHYLNRLFYNLCKNCKQVPYKYLAQKLSASSGKQD
ncbi:MAG: hypothetical protein K2K82_00785 [Muribaculaceae bacterium]|nr:hypothetical protein [Muribaculaceae bacterium]